MEYLILEAGKARNLETDVNKFIEKGWRPQGGIAVADTLMGVIYMQAMLK